MPPGRGGRAARGEPACHVLPRPPPRVPRSRLWRVPGGPAPLGGALGGGVQLGLRHLRASLPVGACEVRCGVSAGGSSQRAVCVRAFAEHMAAEGCAAPCAPARPGYGGGPGPVPGLPGRSAAGSFLSSPRALAGGGKEQQVGEGTSLIAGHPFWRLGSALTFSGILTDNVFAFETLSWKHF